MRALFAILVGALALAGCSSEVAVKDLDTYVSQEDLDRTVVERLQAAPEVMATARDQMGVNLSELTVQRFKSLPGDDRVLVAVAAVVLGEHEVCDVVLTQFLVEEEPNFSYDEIFKEASVRCRESIEQEPTT